VRPRGPGTIHPKRQSSLAHVVERPNRPPFTRPTPLTAALPPSQRWEVFMTSLGKRARSALCQLAAASLATGAIGTADAQTTTLGTRTATSQPNAAITTNASASWATGYTRAADFPNILSLPLQFISLKNGKKLAVLVTFPAILTQTAYRIDVGEVLGGIVQNGNALLVGGKDEFMIRRGYVSVAVDVLGTGMSDGEAALLGGEEQAAYGESVDWVTRQPWFNGQLGLAGTSYLGISSLLTAEQQHPAVKAVFAEVPMGDSYRGTVGIGGLLNAEFVSLWLPLTQSLSVLNGIAVEDNPVYAGQINAANASHVAAIRSWYLPTIDNSLAGQVGYATDDGNFWAVRSPVERAAKIKAPTFIIGSANDIFQRDEPLLYEQLKNNVNTKLVILPGAHIDVPAVAMVGAANSSANGAPSTTVLLLQWFDQYLKGKNTGAASLPNVTQYVQGYSKLDLVRYARATDWPHPQMSPQRLYLHGNMSLSAQAPAAVEATHTVAEPIAPVLTYGISSFGTTIKASLTLNDGSDCSSSYVQWSLGLGGLLPKSCYVDSSTVESAQKALIFETAPMATDTYLNGPMQADIWISASNAEAAISVRVDDVDLFGRAKHVSTGLMSASFRAVDATRSRFVKGVMIQPWHPFTEASKQAVIPGQPMLVPVEVFPAAALVEKGHKLRVAISASNQAMGIWPTPQQARANGNVVTVYNDAAHPSSVVLPIVPTSALN